MNLATIDISTLPSVAIADRNTLPNVSAIYLVLDTYKTPLYIGKSIDIRQRWNTHHRLSQLKDIPGVTIAWIDIHDLTLLDSIENTFIDWFKPPLNGEKFRFSSSTVRQVKFVLKEVRKTKGWSQEYLAQKTGISLSYIQKIEQNKVVQIALDYLDKLCHALDCDISDLLIFTKENDHQSA
ncbi:MAG: helix-turn-helix domain-containing protein [Fischerella sp. CENA71]|nr:helix-turn-helix domain-containing protein [Fischerella sp. CENA71]